MAALLDLAASARQIELRELPSLQASSTCMTAPAAVATLRIVDGIPNCSSETGGTGMKSVSSTFATAMTMGAEEETTIAWSAPEAAFTTISTKLFALMSCVSTTAWLVDTVTWQGRSRQLRTGAPPLDGCWRWRTPSLGASAES